MEIPNQPQANFGHSDDQHLCFQVCDSNINAGSCKRLELASQQVISSVLQNCSQIQSEQKFTVGSDTSYSNSSEKHVAKKNVPKRKTVKDNNRQSTKGLKYYSQRVCDKVEQKRQTTYGAVADELVSEVRGGLEANQQGFDEKNIRRRVYDAINVLQALKIIEKYQKDIRWIGLPQAQNQEQQMLTKKRDELLESNKQKIQALKDLISQVQGYQKLAQKNQNPQQVVKPVERIQVPFLLLKAEYNSKISVTMTDNQSELFFSSDQPYELFDERDVLRKVGLYNSAVDDVEESTSSLSETAQDFPILPDEVEVAQFQGGKCPTMKMPEQVPKEELWTHNPAANLNNFIDSPAQPSPFSYNLPYLYDMAYHDPEYYNSGAPLCSGLKQPQMLREVQNNYRDNQSQYSLEHGNLYSMQSNPCAGNHYSDSTPLQGQSSTM